MDIKNMNPQYSSIGIWEQIIVKNLLCAINLIFYVQVFCIIITKYKQTLKGGKILLLHKTHK